MMRGRSSAAFCAASAASSTRHLIIWSHRKHVVALADKGRVPVMYGYSEFVVDGGLIS
jgi:hypothetical protein